MAKHLYIIKKGLVYNFKGYCELLVYFNFFLIDIIILVSYVLIISTSVHFMTDFINNPLIFKVWVRIT
jgi:hypothetical protein